MLESVYEAVLASALENATCMWNDKWPRFEYDGLVFDKGVRVTLLVEHEVVVELWSPPRPRASA